MAPIVTLAKAFRTAQRQIASIRTLIRTSGDRVSNLLERVDRAPRPSLGAVRSQIARPHKPHQAAPIDLGPCLGVVLDFG